MNYLELCRALVSELGMGGGSGPASVIGQTGKLGLAVTWIRESNLWIDDKWVNWKYHWFEYLEMLQASAGGHIPPAPSSPPGLKVAQWDRSAFYLNKTQATVAQLTWKPWPQFRSQDACGVLQVAKPSVISIKPDNSLILNAQPNQVYSIHGEGWRRPKVLAADSDLPGMPEQFHRVIIARAAVMYGNKEAAPEVISGFEAEYIDLLGKLEANQLEGFEQDTMSTQDVNYAVLQPGAADW